MDSKNFEILRILSDRKMKQDDLSEKTSIDRARISRIINKRLPVPSETEKNKIAEALGCREKEIF